MKLKYPRLKDGVNFKKQGPRPVIAAPDEYLKQHKVVVNWYPKIEAMRNGSRGTGNNHLADCDGMDELNVLFWIMTSCILRCRNTRMKEIITT